METSTELLQLLSEIRDAQRELLAVTKAWKELADQQHSFWQAKKDLYEADRATWLESAELSKQVNERWQLQQQRGKQVALAMLCLVVVGGSILGILVALGWIK